MPSNDQFPNDDELLGLRMVKDRVITDAHLNTALDFQRAIGSTLPEVLLRLGLVAETDMNAYLACSGQDPRTREQNPELVVVANETGGRGDDTTVPLPDPPESKPVREVAQRQSPELESESPLPALELMTESSPESSAGGSGEVTVLRALVALLVRKGVIGPEEIRREILKTKAGKFLGSGPVHLDDPES